MKKNRKSVNWRNRMTLFDVLNTVILTLFSIVCIYPFLNIIALSFNTGTDALKGGITVLPREFTLGNYIAVFRNGTVVNAYGVTILRTVVGTFTSLFVTAMVAYGLSERNLPGKKLLMVYFLIPMFFSGGLIPGYLVLKSVGLLNTFWVYIIPSMFGIWNCVVMKTSFQDIPVSLKEAIRIDGGNEFTILRHIVLPVSIPMFAALGLFIAVGHWNDWFSGAYYVRSNALIPVQTYLMQIMTNDITSMAEKVQTSGANVSAGVPADVLGAGGVGKATSMSLKMAIVVIGTAPILLVYPFLQKYFIKGVLIGSIKE